MAHIDQVHLTIDSTLADLPLYDFHVDSTVISAVIADVLERQPELPGVLVVNKKQFVGVISRQKFFERLGQLYGVAVHFKRPIQVMLDSIDESTLTMPAATGIDEAVNVALSRPQHLVYEPIAVQYKDGTYKLLDVYTLLLAQSKLFALANEMVRESNEVLERRVAERTNALAEANEYLRNEITERKQTEERLRRSEATTQALLNTIPDLIMRIDRNGTYLGFMGAKATQDLNHPIEELVGSQLEDVLPPVLAKQRLDNITRALETKTVQVFEYKYSQYDTLEDYEDRVVACGPDEVLLIARNITERKQAERERLRLMSENSRLVTELGITRDMQVALLPPAEELTSIEGLEIATFMEPAEQVGGDYFDVLQFDNQIKIGIGDVTGHGLDSSITMLMTQTAIRTILTSGESDPKQFVNILNRALYENIQRTKTGKTLTFALLDYTFFPNQDRTQQKGVLEISGQHESIIIVRRDGQLELIDTLELGFPIALEADIAEFVDQVSVTLYSGDVVVLYTDGITEAEDEAQTLYGLERLCEVAQRDPSLSAEAIQQAIIRDVRHHIGKQALQDDLSLLILKQK